MDSCDGVDSGEGKFYLYLAPSAEECGVYEELKIPSSTYQPTRCFLEVGKQCRTAVTMLRICDGSWAERHKFSESVRCGTVCVGQNLKRHRNIRMAEIRNGERNEAECVEETE